MKMTKIAVKFVLKLFYTNSKILNVQCCVKIRNKQNLGTRESNKIRGGGSVAIT